MAKDLITKQQLKELREVFSQFDRDGDGSITELEIGALFRSLGVTPSRAQLESLIEQVDVNKNGLVEFAEFVDLIAPELANEVTYNKHELLRLFEVFDKDRNGFITAAELAHAMARLGHPLSPRELAEMMGEADVDGDGRISFSEFVSAMNNAAFENSLSGI